MESIELLNELSIIKKNLNEIQKGYEALQAKCEMCKKENKDLREALKQLVDVLPKGEKLHYYHAKEQLIYARGVLVIHNKALSAGEGEKEVPPQGPDYGICQRCKQERATARYSNLYVCEHCDKMLNNEFDEEYR